MTLGLDAEDGIDDVLDEEGATLDPLAEPASLADAFARAAVKPAEEPVLSEPEAPVRPPPAPVRLEPQVSPAKSGAGPSAAIAAPPLSRPGPAQGDGFDWEGLANKMRSAGLLASGHRAAETAFSNVAPGYKPDNSSDEPLLALARQPLELAQAKQGMESRDLAMQGQKAALGAKAAMSDPNSLQSQKAREVFRAAFPDMAEKVTGFDNYSADDVGSLTKLQPKALSPEELAHKQALTKQAESAVALNQSLIEQRGAKPALDERKLALDEAEAAEKARHNKATEDAKRRGKGGGGPSRPVRAVGDLMDPGDRAAVQRMLDGVAVPSDFGRKDGGRLLKLAYQIDSTYDPNKAAIYREVSKKLSSDPAVQNANTARKHFERALANLPKTNLDTNAINRIVNRWTTGTGSTGMTQFETDVAIGAGELSKGLGENAEAGKELIRHLLSSDQSPEQIRKRLEELIYLQDEAIQTRREKFLSVAPKGAALPPGLGETPHHEATPAAKTTPSGKPYAKKQVSKSTGRTRYLDAAGNVIEETNG